MFLLLSIRVRLCSRFRAGRLLKFSTSALFCYKHKLHRYLTELKSGIIPSNTANRMLQHIPQSKTDLLISKASFMVVGLATGLALFVEEKRRRAELAMYVLPKGLESLWITLRGHGLVFRTGKWGETLVSISVLRARHSN